MNRNWSNQKANPALKTKVCKRFSCTRFKTFPNIYCFYCSIFSSPEPSGSLDELKVYPCSGVRRHLCRRCCRPRCSNIFSPETASPIKAKFNVGPPGDGGTKVYIYGPGHMTKMAATPLYGKKHLKIFFSRT